MWSLKFPCTRSIQIVEPFCHRWSQTCVHLKVSMLRCPLGHVTMKLCSPHSQVKLMVGAGGEKIKWIQRKSKARIQVRTVCRTLSGSRHAPLLRPRMPADSAHGLSISDGTLRCKCLVGPQVKKDDSELKKGWGTGPILTGVPRGVQKTKDGEVKMVTVMLFGDADQCQKV